MEIHFGVIRDKQEIYRALLQSQSTKRQLAVCFNSEGKLLVKICTVIDIVSKSNGLNVILRSHIDNKENDTTVLLQNIQSVYPIRDFLE